MDPTNWGIWRSARVVTSLFVLMVAALTARAESDTASDAVAGD